MRLYQPLLFHGRLVGVVAIALVLAGPVVTFAATCYWNQSAQTGISLQPDAEEMLALEAQGDGFPDLLVLNTGQNGEFLSGQDVISGFPQWDDKTNEVLGTQVPAASSRPTLLDYNNDGHMDVAFTRGDNLKLAVLQNVPGTSTPRAYQDATTAIGLANNGAGGSVVCADIDNNGWTDIGTSDGANYRVTLNSGGTFGSDLALPYICIPVQPGPMAIMDLDGDEDLDIFVGEAGSPPQGGGGCTGTNVVLLNDGNSPPSFTDATLQPEWFTLRTDYGVTGVAWGEVVASTDGLPRPDLVLSGKSKLYENQGSAGMSFNAAGSYTVVNSESPNALIYDFNLAGRNDILYYLSDQWDTQNTVNGRLLRQNGDQSFTDVTSAAQIEAYGVVSGVALDFDGDGDTDIMQADGIANGTFFMESFDTDECLPPYPCAPATDNPRHNWLRVKLVGTTAGQYDASHPVSTDLIATRVTATATNQPVWVTTGGGGGFAPGLPVTLGLGTANSTSLEIRWPNGTVTTHGPYTANQQVTIRDQSHAYVDDGSCAASTTMGAGTVDFNFNWETVGTDDLSEVQLTHVSGGGDCHDYAITLNPGMGDVSHQATPIGGDRYSHDLGWSNQVCHPNCTLTFQVSSHKSATMSQSTQHTVQVKKCIGL